MKVLFWCCVLIMSILASVNGQRHLNIREKLERLFKDSEYNDAVNEINKPRQTQGMLLKDLNERNVFGSSSEERFFRKLSKSLEKISVAEEKSEEEEEKMKNAIAETTTIAKSTITSETSDEESTTTPTILEQRPSRVGGSLGSIISKLIRIWRN